VYEKILGTVIRRDETEALLVVKPLHFARSHVFLSPLLITSCSRTSYVAGDSVISLPLL
jgi:hypothetical protein